MKYDYDGSGVERELDATAYTLMVYEQEFKSGLIEDVFGRISIPEDTDGMVVADYTRDNWVAYTRALWAMLRSASDRLASEGKPHDEVPSFKAWAMYATNLNLAKVSYDLVMGEIQRRFFRSGAIANEDAAEPEEA